MQGTSRKYVALAVVSAALLIGVSFLAYKQNGEPVRATTAQIISSEYSIIAAVILILIAVFIMIALYRIQKKKNNPHTRTESVQKLQLNAAKHNHPQQIPQKIEQYSQTFFNTIDDFLFVLDAKGNILQVNDAMTERLGYTRNELIGKSVLFIHPEEIEEKAELIIKGVFEGKTNLCSLPLVAKNGQYILVETKLTKGKWNGQDVLFGVSRDITERKKAEMALQRSKNNYRILLENLPQRIFSKDKYLVYVSCNSNFARELDIKPEEIAGKTDYDFFPKQIAEKHRADDQRVITSGKTEEVEDKYIHQEQERFFHTVRTPIKDKQGSVVGLLGISWDVTERKRAEQALQQAHDELEKRVEERTAQLLRANKELVAEIAERKRAEYALRIARDDWANIFESISDVVLILDYDHRILDANRAAIAALKRPKEEIIGKFCYELFHYTNQPVDRCPHKKMLLSERPETVDMEMEAFNGIYQATVAPILDEQGNIVKTIHIAKDITDSKKMEKMLHESEKLAAVGQLAAKIAHEINNPLAGIKNSFLLIKDAIAPDHHYYEYVGRIDKEISRVSRIVHQMFDLYKPGSESPHKFYLREVITDVVALLKVSSEERTVNVEIDISGDSTAVTLTEGLFRQVLFNIIQNAIEASPKGATVKVSAAVSDGQVIVEVADEGAGIDEDLRERIFEPFFTSKTSEANSGLGLGLSVCKSAVDAMGGSISFESQKGEKTVFSVVIPFSKENMEVQKWPDWATY